MIEKTVSEIRINGKKVNNINSLYWKETDTKYIVKSGISTLNDLIGKRWVWNDNIVYDTTSSLYSVYVYVGSATSNNTTYSYFYFTDLNGKYNTPPKIYYGDTVAFRYSNWSNDNYKIFTVPAKVKKVELWASMSSSSVISETDARYIDFIRWMNANGHLENITTTPLSAPVISLTGNILSWDDVTNASDYDIYLNGSHYMYVNVTTINLSQYITEAGTYTVQVKARGTGDYSDSELSNSVTYTKVNTSFTVTFRRVDTAEFAQGFTISIECGTQSLWFGEYDYDTTMQLTVPSSSTPIKVTFNGISGSSYTNSQYIVGSTTGTKTVGTTKTVTVYASSSDNIIDISYVGIS